MALIGWIDFSPKDRDRVGSVLDLLRPEGMVDELGLGTIRDALANELFPGISTVQTRAKYFFIIPYILYEYQALNPAKRKGVTPAQYMEKREYEIMWQLGERYNHEEGNGVIGISKRKNQKIMRRPSAIYWNGLYTYKFLDTRSLPLDVFLRQYATPSLESLLSTNQQGDDSTGDDVDADHENMFCIKVSPKIKWSGQLTLDLGKDEAEFFSDRIKSNAKDKLIAYLLINDELWQIFNDAESFMSFVKKALQLQIANNLKALLMLAHDFSELMYGAHITYNCILHHKAFTSNYWDSEWEDWIKRIKNNMLDYHGFNPENLFTYAITTRSTTKQFAKEWWNLTSNEKDNMSKMERLIQHQEALVKGHKARIRWDKMDDVKEKKWLGVKYFDYRFTQAKQILKDIRAGLKNYDTPPTPKR